MLLIKTNFILMKFNIAFKFSLNGVCEVFVYLLAIIFFSSLNAICQFLVFLFTGMSGMRIWLSGGP